MQAEQFQPHDLLWLQPKAEVLTDAPLPSWATELLSIGMPVVVRRAPRVDSAIPVGLRGASRGLRFPAHVEASSIARFAKPETLIAAGSTLAETRMRLPALMAFCELCQRLPSTLAWGPTGSVGFELATGCPSVSNTSDLDIVLRAPHALGRDQALEMLKYFSDLPCRCDVQLDTPNGGVSLLEWARGSKQVLLKTDGGPKLVVNPWLCHERIPE
ncbi:MAG: malonate decarboxylase holo-ACP synthase [Formivibrio sp.]|nr:malonate decarboxylase holo-ACP synthase [Formivibrio sp.]